MTSWIENDTRNKVYPSSTNGTTHRFYLLVRDDLVRRARRATERGLCQELLQKRCNYPDSHPSKKVSTHKRLPAKDLPNGQDWS